MITRTPGPALLLLRNGFDRLMSCYDRLLKCSAKLPMKFCAFLAENSFSVWAKLLAEKFMAGDEKNGNICSPKMLKYLTRGKGNFLNVIFS